MKRVPRGLLSPARDGLLDPERFSVAERATSSAERLTEEADRRNSASPFVARLQRAADVALNRKGKR